MKRVLLVDDDINLCKVIGYQLQENGFEVTSANRGNAALAYFQKQEFDIVITDIQMPDITGIQVLKAIRRRNRQVDADPSCRDGQVSRFPKRPQLRLA